MRTNIGELILKTAQALGCAVGTYVKDILTFKLEFQIQDAEEGPELPEQHTILHFMEKKPDPVANARL